MYIDTIDNASIVYSVAKNLNIDNMDSIEILNDNKLNHYFNDNNLDEVIVHHLSRRIVGTERTTLNLHDLLTSKNEFTDFLDTFHFNFIEIDNNNIDIYYKNKLVNLDDENLSYNYIHGNIQRIKNRLRYNEFLRCTDSCINGYSIGDIKYFDTTYQSLELGNEFITDLCWTFKVKDMLKSFQKVSKFYMISFKVPISYCIWDGKKNDDIQFCDEIFNAIYKYYEKEKISTPYIRLKDNINLSESNILYLREVSFTNSKL